MSTTTTRRSAFQAYMAEHSPAHASCEQNACNCPSEVFHAAIDYAWMVAP